MAAKTKQAASKAKAKAKKVSKPKASQDSPKASKAPRRGDTQFAIDSQRPLGEALEGQFAVVTKGEHERRYGVVEQVYVKDNKPTDVLFRTRDDDNLLLTIPYDSLERSVAGKR